jgi:hypothetical protein
MQQANGGAVSWCSGRMVLANALADRWLFPGCFCWLFLADTWLFPGCISGCFRPAVSRLSAVVSADWVVCRENFVGE